MQFSWLATRSYLVLLACLDGREDVDIWMPGWMAAKDLAGCCEAAPLTLFHLICLGEGAP